MAAIAQREGQVIEHRHRVVDHGELKYLGDMPLLGRHRHRVVDHGELKYLGDMPLLGRQSGDIPVVEQHAAFARLQQSGNDIQQRGLAAAGRAEQCISLAVFPDMVDTLERVILRPLGVGVIAVRQALQVDLCHYRLPHAARVAAAAATSLSCSSKK